MKLCCVEYRKSRQIHLADEQEYLRTAKNDPLCPLSPKSGSDAKIFPLGVLSQIAPHQFVEDDTISNLGICVGRRNNLDAELFPVTPPQVFRTHHRHGTEKPDRVKAGFLNRDSRRIYNMDEKGSSALP